MAKSPNMPAGMMKRGDKYYANFRHDGRLIRKKLSSNFRVAKEMLYDLQMKKYRETDGNVDNDESISELAEAWFRSISQNLRRSSVKRYRQNMANVFRLIPVRVVRLLTLEIAESFRESRLREGVTPATINKDVGALSTMLNWAVERRKIESNPISALKMMDENKKEERALELAEAEKILCNSSDHWRRIWYAYFATGLRKMELANLLFSDIDWQAREIILRASLTKNGQERRVPIDSILYEILVFQKENAAQRTPGRWSNQRTTNRIKEKFSKTHVFVSTANTPLGNNLYRALMDICKKCDIPTKIRDGQGNVTETVTLHSTRHTFATQLIKNGADPKSVQSLMGHKTLDMTMRIYTKINASQKHDAIGKLSFGDAMPKPRDENKDKK